METVGSAIWWLGFTLTVLVMLALDLGVFHRRAHRVSLKEAALWSTVWVSVSLAFNGVVFWWFGGDRGLEFTTGYLLEYSLSVDNIFVMVLIFQYFAVPEAYQHRVLFWGILGAIVMRALFIFAGTALLQRFHWVMYVFGLVLVVTAIRMLVQRDEEPEPDKNIAVRVIKRFIPMKNDYSEGRFSLVEGGKRYATPLFLVLVTIELTDVVFALDSIPAIFGVTTDPFIVFTSNICAILGLRSLYFLLAGIMDKFHYLKIGLALVLLFIGGKMLVAEWLEIPIVLSLGIVAGLIALSIVASLVWPKRAETGATLPDPGAGAAPEVDPRRTPGAP